MTWTTEFPALSLTSSDTLPSLALTYLSSWSTITLAGPDKKSYLQGQVTCDVVTLQEDDSTLGAHCDAKGKMWSIFRLFHHKDGYALFQPKSALEAELRELKKYGVFSKVEIEQGNDICLGVVGAQAQSYVDQLSGTDQGNVRQIGGGSAVKISDQRWLLVVSPEQAEKLSVQFTETKCDEMLWDLLNILEVQPVLEQSEQNQHIPQAMNLQAVGGISFSKGCYTGQETVARAKYRGINKRALYRVSGPCDTQSHTERLSLERSVGENWRSAGELLVQYQFNDHQASGLIILPNDLEANTQLRLTTQPEQIWHIEPLPYSLNEE